MLTGQGMKRVSSIPSQPITSTSSPTRLPKSHRPRQVPIGPFKQYFCPCEKVAKRIGPNDCRKAGSPC